MRARSTPPAVRRAPILGSSPPSRPTPRARSPTTPTWALPTRSKETAGEGALTTPKPVKEPEPGDCTIVRLPAQVHEPLYPSWGRMNCVSHCVLYWPAMLGTGSGGALGDVTLLLS